MPAPTQLVPIQLVYRQAEGVYLKGPRGVSVDPRTGEIYVADTMNDLVVVFAPNGTPAFAFGYNGEFKEPIKALADDQGRIYVLAGIGNKLKVLDYGGRLIQDFPFDGPVLPVTIALDAEGSLYIADAKSSQVLVYDRRWNLRHRLGEPGDSPNVKGRLRSVQAIAVDGDGTVYVANAQGAPVIQVFGPEGQYLRGWGEHSQGPQNFSLPTGIAIDKNGQLIVVDTLRQTLAKFTREGTFLGREGGLGAAAGAFAFPTDIAVDTNGKVYVVERLNNRLQIFDQRSAIRGRGSVVGRHRTPDRVREEMRRSLDGVMKSLQ
jgi:DNA-binding beta-propeller fold protein YncE